MSVTKQPMSEIVGNDGLKSRICRDIMSNSLSHAYIIEGPKGSGKHTVALMAAAALACTNKDDATMPIPCLECPCCKKIIEKKSPDIIFVGTDGKASMGVDTARFLKEDVHTIPNDLEQKVYIIEDADKMTPQAQNALLLTLEEPPAFVHFFLLCTSSALLLETIRSRAPTLRTEAIGESAIDAYITSHDRRAAQLKLSSPAEYSELLKSSNGGIGRALELLEPKAWKPVKELRRLTEDFVSAATSRRSAKNTLPVIQSFPNKRDALAEQLFSILSAVRDLILLKKSDTPVLCFYCDTNKAIELCDRVSLSFLYSLEEELTRAIDENKRNANIKLLLMKLIVAAELI